MTDPKSSPSKPNAMKIRRVSDESNVSSGVVDNSNAKLDGLGTFFTDVLQRNIDNNVVFYDAHSSDSSRITSPEQMEVTMDQTLKELVSHNVLFTGEDGSPTYNADYESLRNEPDLDEFHECQDYPDIKVAQGIKVYAKDAAGANLAGVHLGKNFATWHCNWLMTWPKIYAVLIAMMLTGGLFFAFYSREFANTGGPAAWHPILEPLLLEIPVFARVILALKLCCCIISGWMGANYSGNHPKYQDGFSGIATHRMIFKLGRYNKKMMWFTDEVTGAEFGLLLPHGSVVMLNMIGGGVIRNLSHRVMNAKHTWILAFDVLLTESK